MRWDEQRVENDMRLPGVGDGTVVRTFDAPEAMGINFHEVRARSALNHVPGDSFGFSWTINPYRGCTHACVFCFARKTHVFLDMDAGRDFEREIVVKVNTPEIVRAEVGKASWKRELVALGTNTDPYQWCEGKYRMLPEILEARMRTGLSQQKFADVLGVSTRTLQGWASTLKESRPGPG